MFTKCQAYSKCFMNINQFNPYNNPMSTIIRITHNFLHLIDEQTETQTK